MAERRALLAAFFLGNGERESIDLVCASTTGSVFEEDPVATSAALASSSSSPLQVVPSRTCSYADELPARPCGANPSRTIPSIIDSGMVRRPLAVANGVGSAVARVATGAGGSGCKEGTVLPPDYRGVPLEGKGRVLVGGTWSCCSSMEPL
jgi:hypothetical protein